MVAAGKSNRVFLGVVKKDTVLERLSVVRSCRQRRAHVNLLAVEVQHAARAKSGDIHAVVIRSDNIDV